MSLLVDNYEAFRHIIAIMADDDQISMPLIYEGHKGILTSVAFNAVGSRLISGSWDNSVREWDLASGSCIRTYEGHNDGVYSVAYHPSGGIIISGSCDKTIRAWDTATGRCIRTYDGHQDAINCLAFNQKGDHFVSGASDNVVREWEVESGHSKAYEGHIAGITSVAYSPKGCMIASSSWDNTVRLWNTENGACTLICEGHTDGVYDVAFSPLGKHIVSASYDKTLRIWDIASGECLRILTGHTEGVSSVDYYPGGDRIASGSIDNTVREWDPVSGEQLSIYTGHAGPVTSVAYNPQGDHIASGSWDMTARICKVPQTQDIMLMSTKTGTPLSCPELTPAYLSQEIAPYINAIAELQHILDTILKIPARRITLHSITMRDTVHVRITGVSDVIMLIREIIMPWCKEHAEKKMQMEDMEKRLEAEHADVTSGSPEENEALRSELNKISLEFSRARGIMFLDLFNRLAPDMPKKNRIVFSYQALPYLETITSRGIVLK